MTQTAEPAHLGHELVGVVEAVGAEVATHSFGYFVIAPFALSGGTCADCRNGVQTSCVHSAWWGGEDEQGLPIDPEPAEPDAAAHHVETDSPFLPFARGVKPQSVLRARITGAYRQPETECVSMLLPAATLPAAHEGGTTGARCRWWAR